MLSLTRLHQKQLIIGIVIAVVFFSGYFNIFGINSGYYDSSSVTEFPKSHKGNIKLSPLHEFWNSTLTLMYEFEPKFTVEEPIKILDEKDSIPGVRTKEALLSRSVISPDVIAELKSKHSSFVKHLPNHIPYKSKTYGIVFIGGGKFSWLSYLSLVALRNIGSTLPVEIVMPAYADYEQEIDFCVNTLPKLNAQCVIVPEVMGPGSLMQQATREKFRSYQFKSLALMVSSFQHVLLLDSDNIPVVNPDPLFESKLYKKYGMVTWPDYWERTTSPVFYDIAGVFVDEKKRVKYNQYPISNKPSLDNEKEDPIPYHDFLGAMQNPSTESGQLMINKKSHSKTLLLSMYYNLNGPNLYYRLLSLGSQGEGDKDTFVAAATVVNEKYYQVNSKVRALGYFHDGGFQGVAMMHKDPVADYNEYNNLIKPSEYQLKTTKEQIAFLKDVDDKNFHAGNDLPYFFMHCNYPKLDPSGLIGAQYLYDETENRLKFRMYSDFKFEVIVSTHAYMKPVDFELHQWKNMNTILCEEKVNFHYFKDKNMPKICVFIKNQITWLSKPKAK